MKYRSRQKITRLMLLHLKFKSLSFLFFMFYPYLKITVDCYLIYLRLIPEKVKKIKTTSISLCTIETLNAINDKNFSTLNSIG